MNKKNMKGLKILFLLLAFGLLVFLLVKVQSHYWATENSEVLLEEVFMNPPEATKPWVFWYWMNDHITKEGITKDLEAMNEVGIGEALIGNIMDGSWKGIMGDTPVLTEKWWGCVEHAIREAGRLGMKIGLFNCPGWSMSGGPWVKPSQSMRYLSPTEVKVKGPQRLELLLTSPSDTFQIVAVQAFRTPKSEGDGHHMQVQSVSSSANLQNAQALFDGNPKTSVSFTTYPAWVEVTFNKPITARSIELIPSDLPMSSNFELQYQDEKGQWETVAKRKIERETLKNDVGFIPFAAIAESFKAVTAQKFRLLFTDQGMVKATTASPFVGRLSEIVISGAARLSHYPEKQLAKMAPTPYAVRWDSYLWLPSAEPESKDLVVEKDGVIDLKNRVDAKGILRWDVPEGEWVVLSTGLVPTGTKNHPVTKAGEGPEVDKMNKEHTQAHFDAFIGEILRRMPAEDRKSLRHVVADSYEQGAENWTEGFAEAFQETYGYSPYPWLPVLTGRIVESASQSDRFLWDMRRLVADLIPANYVGGLRERCEENGLRLWLENYGHWGFPGEFLNYGGASDDIGGEFWIPDFALGPTEVRCASSAGHIYGKNVISAEAFTSRKTFSQVPRDLKARGDWSWTEGINHFVFHVYIHQPYEDKKPGLNAWFGTDFNRHTTWFKNMKPYVGYVRRSTALLQQGIPVADVAYFIGDDTPKMMGVCEPALPKGHDYDFINGEVLLRDARVQDGKIVLPHGVSYKLLVLPPQNTIRPELLKKIRELVRGGAVILGLKPEVSPSMQGYPECDDEVKTMAAELWGKVDGNTVTEGTFGKGKVFSGIRLEDAFTRMGLLPDIVLTDSMLYVHRKVGETDIYFVSNQEPRTHSATVAFRVTGKQPELWDAVTGEIRDLPQFSEKGGLTYIPLEFGPSGSWFVVFRNKAGKKIKGENFPKRSVAMALEGPWDVSFDTALGAPANVPFETLSDWVSHKLEAVKYYSGKATYSKNFEFKGNLEKACFLDLGRVETFATVRLNGQDLGTLWCYPYMVNISKVLKQGGNSLEVDVVNPWWNRLVGDRQPGATPVAWSPYSNWNANSPLLPSGLLGPVKIEGCPRN